MPRLVTNSRTNASLDVTAHSAQDAESAWSGTTSSPRRGPRTGVAEPAADVVEKSLLCRDAECPGSVVHGPVAKFDHMGDVIVGPMAQVEALRAALHQHPRLGRVRITTAGFTPRFPSRSPCRSPGAGGAHRDRVDPRIWSSHSSDQRSSCPVGPRDHDRLVAMTTACGPIFVPGVSRRFITGTSGDPVSSGGRSRRACETGE
jgi:hypothetical protein